MNPENKGWAIGNTPELACAHNSHAIPQARKKTDKNVGLATGRFTGMYCLATKEKCNIILGTEKK